MIYEMSAWMYGGLLALALAAGAFAAATVATWRHERQAAVFWERAQENSDRVFLEGVAEGLRASMQQVAAAERLLDQLARPPAPPPALRRLPVGRDRPRPRHIPGELPADGDQRPRHIPGELAPADGETSFVKALRTAPIDQIPGLFSPRICAREASR
jgi:hypothetical protein